MSTVVLDGSTVRKFVEDNEAFNKTMDEKFVELDANQDGILSRSELRKALESFRLLESEMGMEVNTTPQELNALYDSVFHGFDTDQLAMASYAKVMVKFLVSSEVLTDYMKGRHRCFQGKIKVKANH